MTQGTQIHVAAWPGGDPESAPQSPIPLWSRQLLLSRAFASQASCYVVAAGSVSSLNYVPERYHELYTRDYTGDSYIIDPRGEVIAGPAKEETILTAQGSIKEVLAAKAALDVGGHYSRPDVFQLLINRSPLERLIEKNRPDISGCLKGNIPDDSTPDEFSSTPDNDA
jgi:nitrilase